MKTIRFSVVRNVDWRFHEEASSGNERGLLAMAKSIRRNTDDLASSTYEVILVVRFFLISMVLW